MRGLAPYAFVLLWSSSFIAARIGLRHLTPLLFVAIRLTGCAIVLIALMLLARRRWPPPRDLLHCGIAGALVNAIGLMAPHEGLTMVAAAPIALVQSLTPVLTGVVGAFFFNEALRPWQWLGLMLGVAGVALVVGLEAEASTVRLDGMLLAGLGVAGLVAGTIWFRRFCRDVPLLPGGTAQFIAAAAVGWIGMALFETPHATWTPGTIIATGWNTCAVSLGGMALYFFMLSRSPAARTTSNFYLVPGTVAILGWLLLGEHLTALAITGFIVAGLACWLVSSPTLPMRKPVRRAQQVQ
ncbi:MAG: DMT family transporter [Acetobacteraceae bacterium]|nr:DMT family transporter [Acetobacteraceae bacterium]